MGENKNTRHRKEQRRRARARNAKLERAIICPYDGEQATCIDSAMIYHGTSFGWAWRCPKCGAYVGCHKGTKIPLGRLANNELRKAKVAAHRAFDMLWANEEMTRSEAYQWLTKAMGRTEQVHIGEMDVDDCKLVVDLCVGRERY